MLLGIRLLGATFWCGLSNYQAAMGTRQAEFSPRINKYRRVPTPLRSTFPFSRFLRASALEVATASSAFNSEMGGVDVGAAKCYDTSSSTRGGAYVIQSRGYRCTDCRTKHCLSLCPLLLCPCLWPVGRRPRRPRLRGALCQAGTTNLRTKFSGIRRV